MSVNLFTPAEWAPHVATIAKACNLPSSRIDHPDRAAQLAEELTGWARLNASAFRHRYPSEKGVEAVTFDAALVIRTFQRARPMTIAEAQDTTTWLHLLRYNSESGPVRPGIEELWALVSWYEALARWAVARRG